MLTDDIKEQRSGTVSPPVGSVRSLASGRYQARYFDPDTRGMVPAPQTFATKGAADKWLAVKRTELDAGTAVDEKQAIGHYANGGPVIGGQPKAASPTPALAMRLRGGCESSRGSVRCRFAGLNHATSMTGLPT